MNPPKPEEFKSDERPLAPSQNAYLCLGSRYPHSPPYRLCTLRRSDIQQLRRWRNDQMNVLRQSSRISPGQQERYFDEIVRRGFGQSQPEMILLSLLREHDCIGYTGLTHIDWPAGRAEISFLVDPIRANDSQCYAADFGHCLEMLSYVAFENLGLNRLFAETFDIRSTHVAILESAGYQREGRLREHVSIDGHPVDSLVHGLLRSDWRTRDNEPPD